MSKAFKNSVDNEDDDDVYDEIDHFHNQRESTLNFVSSYKPFKKEVLSVRVDDKDNENLDYEDQDFNNIGK